LDSVNPRQFASLVVRHSLHITLGRSSNRACAKDIETETLIFEARILAESIAMGLGRVKDPSEIPVVRRRLSELDAILSKALVVVSTGDIL
jgi:hypothetical protein